MGQALQKTHQYGKAINYYREAVKNEDHGSLRYDLAELLVCMKQLRFMIFKIIRQNSKPQIFANLTKFDI